MMDDPAVHNEANGLHLLHLALPAGLSAELLTQLQITNIKDALVL
jgi:hypothetical protein